MFGLTFRLRAFDIVVCEKREGIIKDRLDNEWSKINEGSSKAGGTYARPLSRLAALNPSPRAT